MLDLTQTPDRPLLAASVLASDFGAMAADAKDVLDAGADLLHVDVMDGHFVPNLTFGTDMIKGLRKHLPDVNLDVHLMVQRPQDYMKPFADAGANGFTFHIEVCDPYLTRGIEPRWFIDEIRKAGMVPGITINPATPTAWIEPMLDHVDLALVMSVQPGYGGQAFMPHTLDKAKRLRELGGERLRVQMDGGLDPQTSRDAVAAGVDVLVAGSAVFGSNDRAATIRAMQKPV
ncbi:MAG: ribulose-phosphate 3-epimerase [Planctomycetota bacterium]